MYIAKEIIDLPNNGFPVRIRSVSSIDEDISSMPHFHNEIELLYICEGHMQFIISDEVLNIYKGQLLFINSCVNHASRILEETKIYILQFDINTIFNMSFFTEYKYLIPFLMPKSRLFKIICAYEYEYYEQLLDILETILYEFNTKGIAYEIKLKSLLYNLLTVLYRSNIIDYDHVIDISNDKDIFLQLRGAFDYVDKNYVETITVKEACEKVNLSYHHFCRLFKKATGRSFMQYVNHVRISVAEKMLISTNLSITDIMHNSGFSSISYFNRVFKKDKGCSPTVFRSKLKD